MTAPPCSLCGEPSTEQFGNGHLCEGCIPGGETADDVSTVKPGVYPPAIREREWWVTWILDGVERKRPVAPWQTGHAYPVEWRGDLDPEDRPETDFETAKRWADFRLADLGLSLPDDALSEQIRLGIILPVDRPPRDERVVLIDWDDVRDPETGEIHPVAVELIERFGGYVEVSRSGEGLHQFVYGGLRHRDKFIAPIDTEPFVGEDVPQVEIYDGGRHVAMTGDHLAGSGEDVIDGQECIDTIVREYAEAEMDAGHRTYDPRTGATRTDAEQADDGAESPTPAPEPCEYRGPELDELRETKPADRSLAYHAVVEAFCEGYAGALNWRLEGAAAALGEREDRTAEEVIEDLRGAGREDGSVGYDKKTPGRVRYDHARAGRGEFNPASWETLASWGVLPRELVDEVTGEDAENGPDLTESDPLALDVTLDAGAAWRAAAAVTPEDVADDFPAEPHSGDSEAWRCPSCGEPVRDVVRVLAVAEGAVECCVRSIDDPDAYHDHYQQAREQYDAPLPQYVSAKTATEDMDLAAGAVGALRGWHIYDGLQSEVTNENPGKEVVAAFDPTWEETESDPSERVILFESGLFYCRKHKTVIHPLQVVALENGLIDAGDTFPSGKDYLTAYRLAREQYGAALPDLVWNRAEDTPEPKHIPVLPSPEELVGEGVTTDAAGLGAARSDVEALYRSVVADEPDRAYLMSVLPALGKTTSAIKAAADHPTLYTAGRKDLMEQAMRKAEEHGVRAKHLPVLGPQPPEDKVAQAVNLVRENGRDLLEDPEALLAAVGEWDDENDGDCVCGATFKTVTAEALHECPEPVELDRETCATADGSEGQAWQLAAHVARALGHKPREIHERAETIFGEPAPCSCDGPCDYSRAWEEATDPDAPFDLLIGHYIHAHVPGARTYAYRGENDRLQFEPRVVAIDEYPGDVFGRDFGGEYLDHALWLARCLHPEIDDRQELLDRRDELWGDGTVYEWVQGDAELASAEPIEAMAVAAAAAAGELEDDPPEDVREGVVKAGENATLPEEPEVGGDLLALVERAATAFENDAADAYGILRATATALQGGQDGIEALTAGASDGYAHPSAPWLLLALLAPDELEPGAGHSSVKSRVLDCDTFDFVKRHEGTRVKSVGFNAASEITVLLDRNHGGASIHRPPAFDTGGGYNTVVGLDATGRERLWSEAIGCDVRRRDIHETTRERRAFLRDVLNLQVVQTSKHVKSYEGSPAGKNFDGDVALVDEIASEFSRLQLRQDRLAMSSAPGVITTKCVKNYIGGRLRDAGAAEVDNYGNVTGINRLAEHNVGVILGSQHFGDYTLEKWAALGGEAVDREGYGEALDYNSELGNEYLQHMREDQTMQAVLRFGRDEEGAVVFAHTSALREDLPVIAEGAVVDAYSAIGQDVARAAAKLVGEEFTVGDLADDVDGHRRSIRRVLNEFTDLGYLDKTTTGDGLANTFTVDEVPGTGNVELPTEAIDVPDGPPTPSEGGGPPGQSALEESNTGFVWVVGLNEDQTAVRPTPGTVLPAPEAVIGANPPG